ncbi:hypothetical protein VH564_05220 [Rhizobium sp. HT1-10]
MPTSNSLVGGLEEAAVALQASPLAASTSDEMTSLDEQIAALRTQFASKLRLQNAVEEDMARFER